MPTPTIKDKSLIMCHSHTLKPGKKARNSMTCNFPVLSLCDTANDGTSYVKISKNKKRFISTHSYTVGLFVLSNKYK